MLHASILCLWNAPLPALHWRQNTAYESKVSHQMFVCSLRLLLLQHVWNLGKLTLLCILIVMWAWDSWLWHENNKSYVTRLLWGLGKRMSVKYLAQCLLHRKCSVKKELRLRYRLIIGFLMVGTCLNYHVTPTYFVAHRRQLCLLRQRDVSLSLSHTHTHTHIHTHPKDWWILWLHVAGSFW